jgi:hypothetical protein
MDSNHDSLDQNQKCYRYTTGHSGAMRGIIDRVGKNM